MYRAGLSAWTVKYNPTATTFRRLPLTMTGRRPRRSIRRPQKGPRATAESEVSATRTPIALSPAPSSLRKPGKCKNKLKDTACAKFARAHNAKGRV
jgi:hypothetical protein